MKKNTCYLTAVHILGLVLIITANAFGAITVTDTRGRHLRFETPPERVVSIVPSMTEVICNIGAADHLVGVTYHSTLPLEKNTLPIMGGFSSPDLSRITALDPDAVFVSGFQKKITQQLEDLGITTICLDTPSFDQGLENIRILGKLLDRIQESEALLSDIDADIAVVTAKLDRLGPDKRKRVFRLMGRDTIMTPAAGSFMNEVMRKAGGIPMAPKTPGMVTEVSLDQWQAFNPQFIYGCGEDRRAADTFFDQPGWKDVDAVQNGNLYYFPCEMTCRVSSYTGQFIQWLATAIYPHEFYTPENQVKPDEILGSEEIPIALDMVKGSRRVTTRLADFTHKTLVVDFNRPQTVLSTLEGMRSGITTIGNHYLPPPAWSMAHTMETPEVARRVLDTLQRNSETSAILMTGADMDHLTVTRETYKEMEVTALITAGVCSNAQRASRSTGFYYDPGTINIIVMTNRKLSPRAMTRALIAITEGKSAAMADLDIRSSDDPAGLQATGTGTDNIIVVQGEGSEVEGSGGHTKMGELLARAAYEGVTQAVALQNGIRSSRNIFQRLEERRISIHTLARTTDCRCSNTPDNIMARELESLLMIPRYAGMVEQAFALTDALDREQVHDLSFFEDQVMTAALSIAGTAVDRLIDFESTRELPRPLALVFNGFMTGIAERFETLDKTDKDVLEPKKSRDQMASVSETPRLQTGDAASGSPADLTQNTTPDPNTPERIVSLGPVLTKTLDLLGAGDHVVADTTYCEDPAGAPPREKIGSLIQVNVEKIISLKPDLVLASQFTKPKQIKVLRDFDIHVVPFQNPRTFEEICTNTLKVGELVGKSAQAQKIITRARQKVADIQSRTAEFPKRKVFIQIGIKPLHTANDDTFVNEFIRLSGGTNIAAGENSGVYSREKVVSQNPDVILISTMGSSKSAGVTEKAQWMAFTGMQAVRDDAIHLLDSEMICSPTPLVFAGGLETVARLIHPEMNSKG